MAGSVSRFAEGESAEEVLLDNHQFSEASLGDLQRASRLQPRDHALIGSVVLFEIYTVSARQGRMDWADFSWSTLPEKSQRSIRDAVTRLATCMTRDERETDRRSPTQLPVPTLAAPRQAHRSL